MKLPLFILNKRIYNNWREGRLEPTQALVVVAKNGDEIRIISFRPRQRAGTRGLLLTGSKTTTRMSKADVLKAVRRVDHKFDYVWDGKAEENRPAGAEELVAAMSAYRRKRGRPAGSGAKEQIALRVDRDVLARFRAEGPGWQTRMNEALKDWLRAHRRRPGA